MSMIELKNIKKFYNENTESEVQALNDINLKIEKGDFCSIVGSSGSGKSTLLYILGGIDKPTAGKYLLDNEEVSKLNEKKLAKLRNKKFGFVLQDFGLIEEETSYNNIYTPILFSLNKEKNISQQIKDISKMLEIEELLDKKVKLLSGGQRQRVAIARALINNPDIILADEPTGALDSKTANIIMQIFIELNKSGKTVIIVTHNMEIANRTDKCFVIKDGIICKTK